MSAEKSFLHRTFINLSQPVHGLLWVFCPPIYAIGVLFRDFTFLQKVLRIASLMLNPGTWGYIILSSLFIISYLDEQEQKEREEMATTCSSDQLVPPTGTIECVPYENVTKWSDKIGQADTQLLQNTLQQDTITVDQIISKHVSITQTKQSEYSEQLSTVSYVLKDLSDFEQQEQVLIETNKHQWSPEEEYEWEVGSIYKNFPLSTETWSVVLNDFRVRWPETPLLFTIQGTTLHPNKTTSTDTFNTTQVSSGYDWLEGTTYNSYHLSDTQTAVQFNIFQDNDISIHTQKGWVSVSHDEMYMRDSNAILGSTLIIHDADNGLTYVQYIE